ncbi:MAG TPA: hypothetical protein VKE69_12940 [Planctomycetota bacterium]|nr:hypothetical protein [Planctomycetota bacterium]
MHRIRIVAPLALATLAASAAAQTPVPPSPGELVVSEIMFNPLCAGSQDTGEWFEVTNVSNKVLDVNGVYFQDGPIPGASQRWFQVLPSVATLPPLFPNQRFLFARSAARFENGSLQNVDYAYAAAGPDAPADHSQVGHSQMSFSSQDVDGCHISIGAPIILGGTLIDTVSVNPVGAPFGALFQGGISAERINLKAPMVVSGFTNSANLAKAVEPIPSLCVSQPDLGTPRLPNTADATVWGAPFFQAYDDASFPNSGTITPLEPASVSGGLLRYGLGNGPAGQALLVAVADSAAPGLPIGLFLPGNPGSFVINLATATFFDPAVLFDGTGSTTMVLPIPPVPSFVGATIATQWVSVAPPLTIVLSHGELATFVP